MKAQEKRVPQVLFLLAYVLLLVKVCIGNTTFLAFVNTDHPLFLAAYVLAAGIIAVKVFFFDLPEYSTQDFVLAAILSSALLISYFLTRFSNIMAVLLLIIGARKVDGKAVTKCHFCIYGSIMLLALLCSATGWIENYTIVSDAHGIRYSLGNTYPTDFAAGIFYLAMDYAYFKRTRWNGRDSVVLLVISAITFYFTSAITSFLMCVLLAGVLYFSEKEPGKRKILEKLVVSVHSVFDRGAKLAFPISAAISVIAVDLYSMGSRLMEIINKMVNYRIGYAQKAMQEFGFSIFGKRILFIGGGWGTDPSAAYYYVDNGYIYTGIVYGMLTLLTLLALFSFLAQKVEGTNHRLSIILCFIAVSSFLEPRWIHFLYNPFLCAISFLLTHHQKNEISDIGG